MMIAHITACLVGRRLSNEQNKKNYKNAESDRRMRKRRMRSNLAFQSVKVIIIARDNNIVLLALKRSTYISIFILGHKMKRLPPLSFYCSTIAPLAIQ